MTDPNAAKPNVYPTLGYRDAPAAIDWLCEAFGFETLMVHPGEGDRDIAHAELSLPPGVVMVGSLAAGAASAAPAQGEGPLDFAQVPFSIYVAIDDVDAHCARARAAGAVVESEPADTFYDSREYICRDLEGNVWTFGTYRPAV
jgi:uncharacterized glyoxalase superfamily protein PhnB